ncbi:precorrin-6A reductase [Pelobacter seleniigenes]|uniref:precorrin-6A reductase n=1 Tax=Pelobacter seleniigenes TaxID=407188 RepID=UPI000689EE8A|nr:precorrin-6A reductase [Pelobacter seleniigenes]
MILLFGGTSETAGLAESLAGLELPVLVSTATDAELDVGRHPLIRRRCGRLDEEGMSALLVREGLRLIVDASHPFAVELQRTARAVAARYQLPYFRFQRPACALSADELFEVADHQEAAELAVSFGSPVLLTTGSRNLEPYVHAARREGVPLFVRVLPHPDAVAACAAAGIPEANRIFARGPFSEEQNRKLIATLRIGVLVTKDSGVAGGVAEKIAAARKEDCLVIMIRRPAEHDSGPFEHAAVTDIPTLLDSIRAIL